MLVWGRLRGPAEGEARPQESREKLKSKPEKIHFVGSRTFLVQGLSIRKTDV